MKSNPNSAFNGMKKVFGFTLKRQTSGKTYRTITIIFALLCFLLPTIIMPIAEKKASGKGDELKPSKIETVYVIDLLGGEEIDYNCLTQTGIPSAFDGISYENVKASSSDKDALIAAAEELTEKNTKSVILLLEEKDASITTHVLRPKHTDLKKSDAVKYADFLEQNAYLILVYKSGVPFEALGALSIPTASSKLSSEDLAGSGLVAAYDKDGNLLSEDDLAAMKEANRDKEVLSEVKDVLSFLLPYLNIMVMYFLVLFFGQGVSNIVVMEKSSKLMDTFLLSVKPSAMVFGKVFACACTSAIQFLTWIVCLILGFATGYHLVLSINPDSDMTVILFLRMLGNMSGLFTLSGVVIGILIILAGFLMYCALASLSGSLASKAEDLAATNGIFTMFILVSFFALFGSGAMMGHLDTGLAWYDIIPFTSILVTPSRLMLGNLTITEGLISLAIVLALTVFIVLLAGKIYRLMSLYKGNPPKPSELRNLLKTADSKQK